MDAGKSIKQKIGYLFFILLLISPLGLLISTSFDLGYVFVLIIIFAGISFVAALPPDYFRYEFSVFYLQVFYTIYSLSIFPFSLGIQNMALVIFPGLILAYAVKNIKFESIFNFKIFGKKDIAWLIVFLVFFTGSIIRNADDYTNIYSIIRIFGFVFFLFFYVLVVSKKFLNYRNVFNAFLKFLSVFGALMGIVGIFSFFIYFANAQRPGMASGIFINPNTFGYFLVSCLTITLSVLLFKKADYGDLSKPVLLMCFLIMLVAEILTLSRTSWISFIFALSVIAFFRSKKLFLGVLIAGAVSFSVFVSVLGTVKGEGSFLTRIGLWISAIEMFNSSSSGFLFGFGALKSFAEYQDFKILIPGVYDVVDYPHNILLFFIMQFGLLCLIVISLYIFSYLYKAVKLIALTRKKNFALLLSFIFCSTILIQSMFEDMLMFPNYFIYPVFLTFFGILRYTVNGYKPES